VTGLSRAGKTVFLTALVNNLIANASFPSPAIQPTPAAEAQQPYGRGANA
jgi:predicted YcjX-like family ATPase